MQELNEWAPRMLAKLRTVRGLVHVNSDQQDQGAPGRARDRPRDGRQARCYDANDRRHALRRLRSAPGIDHVHAVNQYHVVMEVEPRYLAKSRWTRNIFTCALLRGSDSLQRFHPYEPSTTALAVTHQGQFPSVTFSFNLPPGMSWAMRSPTSRRPSSEIGLPASIHGSFQGTAQAFQASLANEPMLIAAALVTVYIVLGVLYESTIHPITICPPCRRREWARCWRCCYAAPN